MATTLHTFSDIFNAQFESSDEPVQLKKIIIPKIQRDYAQGRKDPDIDKVRARFLDSLHAALTDKPIVLDFIYGDIDESGILTPLDGQQRLTTLFLLHWYAAKKENIDYSEYEFLNNFGYETRYSARDFCSKLIKFEPSFEFELSDEIIDQAWFPLDWLNDQTVNSMLVMLNAIQEKFFDIKDIWDKLKNGAITFYFLPIKDMGLTDEIYIKMNSRGKPLTPFEHFKAELELSLKEIDPDISKRIIRKIDREWTDLLWRYRGNDNVTDDEFLRYFSFICDIICYRDNDTPQGKARDVFALVEDYFSIKCEKVSDNIEMLESFFDCWLDLPGKDPGAFFEKIVSHEHEPGKVKIENRYRIDLFEDCLRNYGVDNEKRNRAFPLNEIILLYSVIFYLLHKDSIPEKAFIRRFRSINNLVLNSIDQISDSVNRISGNRMPAILRQVGYLLINNTFEGFNEAALNASQVEEEQMKLRWSEAHPYKAALLYEFEDNDLIYGQIGILGLNEPKYFSRFKSLFECDRDCVDRALMATGDYMQTDKNGWRLQAGSSSNKMDLAWRNLFHRSTSAGFDKTSDVLKKLLSVSETFDDDKLIEIAESYLKECEEKNEYSLRYYYVKYPSFRPGRYGKYSWLKTEDCPYEFMVLRTESYMSSSSYQPFLQEIDSSKIVNDDYGKSLNFGDKFVQCKNSAYVVYDSLDVNTRKKLAELPIKQNENGIDIEDRIVKARAELPGLLAGIGE